VARAATLAFSSWRDAAAMKLISFRVRVAGHGHLPLTRRYSEPVTIDEPQNLPIKNDQRCLFMLSPGIMQFGAFIFRHCSREEINTREGIDDAPPSPSWRYAVDFCRSALGHFSLQLLRLRNARLNYTQYEVRQHEVVPASILDALDIRMPGH